MIFYYKCVYTVDTLYSLKIALPIQLRHASEMSAYMKVEYM